MPSKFSEIIKSEKGSFETNYLKMNPSYAQKQSDILELIDSYWMSKYKQGDNDSTGYKKAFYNIVINPVEIASKMIDLDTKDIRIIAEDGQSYYPSWMMSKDLKIWMKDKKNKDKKTFGQFLNQLIFQFPKYGHILLKKAANTVHLVPLQNVINTQDAKSLLASDFLIERHEYTAYQITQQNWGENQVNYAIANYLKDGKIIVYEIHGDCGCPLGHNYHIIPEDAKDEEVLFEDTIDRDDLYKELKWDEIPGRALSRGQAERLFEGQIAKNQTENLFRMGLRWTSKHIFQTRDDTVIKNLITAVENGDIMTINSEITPISVEERNLAAYNWGDQKWDKNTSDLTFSYEPLSGQRPPSGTPLGTSILQTNLSGQFYDLKREDLGLFLKDVLFDWIIPEFKKEKKSAHSLMTGEFDEDELDRLRNLILTNRANQSILRYVSKNLSIPSSQEAEVIKAIEKEKIKKIKELKLPDSFYEDLKYKIDVVITNEQIDIASRMSTLQTVLQIIGSNPTILREPRTRKVFYKLLDLAGFSPVDFGITEEETSLEETMGQVAQMGGSVARPQAMRQPQEMSLPRRL